MKRFHVHVGVQDLNESVRFYTGLFGAEPTVLKPDYAKWMVEDPRIQLRNLPAKHQARVNHLGLQVDEADELPGIQQRFEAADKGSLVDEIGVTWVATQSRISIGSRTRKAWRGKDGTALGKSSFTASNGASRLPRTDAARLLQPPRLRKVPAVLRPWITNRLRGAGAAHDAAYLQRAVPVHRQLRAQHHRRGAAERRRWLRTIQGVPPPPPTSAGSRPSGCRLIHLSCS